MRKEQRRELAAPIATRARQEFPESAEAARKETKRRENAKVETLPRNLENKPGKPPVDAGGLRKKAQAEIERSRHDQARKDREIQERDAALAEKERRAREEKQQKEKYRRDQELKAQKAQEESDRAERQRQDQAAKREKDRKDHELKARKAKEEFDRAEKRRQDQAAQKKEHDRLLQEKRARDEQRRKEERAEQQRLREQEMRREAEQKRARQDEMNRLKELERREREKLPKLLPKRGMYHENLEDKDPDDFYRINQPSILGRDDLNAAARTFIEGLHPVDWEERKKVEVHNKMVQWEREKQQKAEADRAQREVDEHNKKWKKLFENK